MKFQLLSILFAFSFLINGLAQNNIRFNNYTINEGLSQSVVYTIVQDNFGAIWIGTQDGLNRFDGKTFEILSSGDTEGISNEYILSSTKDAHGVLYFGTNVGLLSYNPELQKFQSYHVAQGKKAEITRVLVDGDKVWMGSADGRLLLLDKETKVIKNQYDIYIGHTITGLSKLAENKLLITTENGEIIEYNYQTNESNSNRIIQLNETFRTIRNLKKIEGGAFIICTNQGVVTYANKEFKSDYPSLNAYDVNDIYIDNKQVYIATLRKGIIKLSEDGKIVENTSDLFQKSTILDNQVHILYKDNSGLMWAGSQRGVSNFSTKAGGFSTVSLSADPSKGLNGKNVWFITKDNELNNLLIGTSKGVTIYNQPSGKYHHLRSSDKVKEGENIVLYIHKHTSKQYFLGTSNGFYKLDIDPNNYAAYSFTKIPITGKENAGFDKVYSLVQEKNKLVLGTKGGVAIYDINTGTFEIVENNPSDLSTIGEGAVRLVYKDKHGDILVAPSSGSLFKIKISDTGAKVSTPTYYPKLKNNVKEFITSIYQTDENNFWIGTVGGGLYHLNVSNNDIEKIGKEEGLPNEVIYSIQSVDNDNLFMSSNKGIIKYNIHEKSFQSYREKDGLSSDECNLSAGYVDNEGIIYFGTIMGYDYFDPTAIDGEIGNLTVNFSELWMENELIQPAKEGLLQRNIANTKTLNLPYKHNAILLKFFSAAYGNLNKLEYKYTLIGESEIEESLHNTNELRFTSLSPGGYTLKVFVRGGNEGWSKNPATLQINVAKPFWMTWLFRIIALAVVALLVFVYIKRRIEEERREQVRLEMRIKARTKELEEKTVKIEQQKAKIEEQKAKIEKQKEIVEKEKDQSNQILKNILPEENIADIKRGKSKARDFQEVSVMFTDFVGFTTISDDLEANELVGLLDKYFRAFDEIIGKHELEKIKTIGDAYMCAGGVPIRSKTNAVDTVLAGIQIREYVKLQQKIARETGDIEWKVRIGINTGPITAGVIGTRRYAYDIWGKTVNHAQRMERLCTPGRVAITGSTFEGIEAYFECSFAGIVESKSKGKIEMYYVDAIKSELSVNGEGVVPNEAFHKLVVLHHFSAINYMKAEREIMRILTEKLSPNLHYHSIAHTKDVTRMAERIAIGEGITDDDLFLLKSAASFHDAGFIEQYAKNEPIGARMAADMLLEFGYTEKGIKRIEELIYATTIPHQPKNLLEEIICDADLDYLGRDDFHPIADKLRLELREHGIINSDRAWDEMQVKFLKMHKYFTKTSIDTRRAKKMENLKEVEERLARNEYVD